MKITTRKMNLIGALLVVAGLITLFISKWYTANCAMPCGYFDNTRSIVIKIGISMIVLGVVAVMTGLAQVIFNKHQQK